MRKIPISENSRLSEDDPERAFVERARPGLHISNIVYGRQRIGNRVEYLVDPQGREAGTDIPEQVVLQRWRMRRKVGYSMSGTRLSPTIWRAMVEAFGPNAAAICALTPAEIRARLDRYRPALRAEHLKLPNEGAISALVQACGPIALQALLDRHMSPGWGNRSGVPDLFLYARETTTQRLATPFFVEVKKPGERISADQRSEIAYMLGLGLPARVLVLIER